MSDGISCVVKLTRKDAAEEEDIKGVTYLLIRRRKEVGLKEGFVLLEEGGKELKGEGGGRIN